MVGFLFGGDTGETAQSLARRRQVIEALSQQIMGAQPKTAAEGIGALLKGAAVGFGKYRADKAEKAGTDTASTLYNSILGNVASSSAASNPVAMGGNMPKVDSKGNISTTTSGDVYSGFMDTVKGGITNPFGLAAVASTGNAESRFSSGNANRSWSDPSERGAPGTAGGIMSWRGPRLEALYSFAGQKGEKPGAISPQTQAEFFLQEDPNLVAALNNATSVEEAQQLMNRAWQFAGWNRPGGEAAARMSSANAYLPKFQGQPQSREVASLDPSIGMPDTAADAVTAMASGTMPATSPFVSPFVDPAAQSGAAQAGASLSDEVAAYEQTPEYAARFPGRSAQAPGMEQPRDVSALPVPPQSQPLPEGIPAQFQGSQQLASAQGGMMPALTSGAPASPQQIAQAEAVGQQQPAQFAQSAGGVDPRLYELLANDFATPEMKAVARSMIEQQMLANDPMRQLEMRKLQQDLNAPRKRETSVVNGRLVDNQTGQVIAEYPDAQKPTADRQNYEYYREFETQNGRTPLGPLEWEQAQRKAGAGTTNVSVGESDKFYENLDKKNAESFAALSDAGMQARARMGQINRLEGIFANVPQGIEGGFKKIAGDWGIPIGEGTSDIQAASALLEKMVPEQRAPGSGPMSDADIRMFRASLPRIINQPGGNELIFQTMRGISEYEQQMGVIADAVADREITPAEGRKRIREMQNPLENYKIPNGPTPNEGTRKTQTGVNWSYE
ncbi:hypothetical protein ASD02_00765 [Ensifer sp. Root1252]|nr:hypothetical protein ASD02_00765 [Ensifer sp. Root1252]KRC83517.1 hypothetical protein ASE32_00760 [Ensifer sp. Root231]KRC86578.1 hypothetical protein ASE47_16890 [Ensifer sp. Root258]